LSKEGFLPVLLLVQVLFCVGILLDIPVFRQLFGFLYLTFIPGFLLCTLLNLNELETYEIVLLSVGLSLALLSLIGLLLNEMSVLIGLTRPLSPIPLLLVFTSFALGASAFIRRRRFPNGLLRIEADKSTLGALFLVLLPALSIIGTTWVNLFHSNAVLLLMLLVVLVVVAVGLGTDYFPPKLYPLAAVAIAVSLLLHSSLISNYIVSFGSDVPGEFFVFRATEVDAFWSSTSPRFLDLRHGRLNAMLSITILPTIYSALLGLESAWIFKMLYPVIFSIVPLGLYVIWQRHVGKKYAFVSVFVFVAQQTFYSEIIGLNRQMIAELFFVLLLFVAFTRKIRFGARMVLFFLFSFGLITSHYGLAEIFLFLIAAAWVFLMLMKAPRNRVTAGMILFFFVLMFSWYIYTSASSVFQSTLMFGDEVYGQLGDFLNPAARGTIVLRGLGLESAPTILNTISRLFAYAIQLLIVIGFVGLALKRVSFRYEKENLIFTSIAIVILFALLLVPGLADTLRMTRFYHILLFFLAPLAVMGTTLFVKEILKRKGDFLVPVLMLIILVPYFLFQTSFIYAVTGSDSWSIPLSKDQMSAFRLYGRLGYTDAFGAFGASWISENVIAEARFIQIYGDIFSRANELRSYGMVHVNYVEVLSNVTSVVNGGVVYTSPLNVLGGVVVGDRHTWNTTDLRFLDDLNRIYSNGASEIYVNP
jgi:uncharacterized membrane protein